MANSISRIRAPAKLNIRLKVINRRPDGYHELVSVMVPVELCDILELEVLRRNRIELVCEGYQVPDNEDNLVCRAAASFFSKTGIDKGVSLKLTKKIPVAAGLGGGSSDAAATLLSLNKIHSDPLSMSDLHGLAVKLGADVPFFLACRPSLARGIGEILEPLRDWPEYWYIIVTPPIRVSTSWVYENLKLELTSGEYDYILATLKNDPFKVSHVLENDLEKVTSASFPIIDTLKKLLMDVGAEGAIMSGSGPSVFGLFSSFKQAISAKKSLISKDLGDVFIAKGWEKHVHRL
ncbi:MAG: 4-(cytidine 5'-diphospho)-2-C-methyl-D-erythritol kinase [Deltaproteobacteria bacterium]|nr:4-(cytidine 5'-diphospho)-2-C-methyl-D-erythritol kinase [Deltaproteobacteria bacterium]